MAVRTLACSVALLFCGCTHPRAAPPDAAAPPAIHETQDECLRRLLLQSGLNPYGDPPGTMYSGGSPLFDEATGQRTALRDYVNARHPELVRRCPPR